MKQVKVSDHHIAKFLAHFSMKKGGPCAGGCRFGTEQNFMYEQKQVADVILRITPKNFCLYDAQGEKISLTVLMKEMEEKHMEWIEVFGFYKYKGKTGFVRVIAYRLPDGQEAKARKRRTRKASKNQHGSKQKRCSALDELRLLHPLVQNTVAKKFYTCAGAAGRWSFCLNVSIRISPSVS